LDPSCGQIRTNFPERKEEKGGKEQGRIRRREKGRKTGCTVVEDVTDEIKILVLLVLGIVSDFCRGGDAIEGGCLCKQLELILDALLLLDAVHSLVAGIAGDCAEREREREKCSG
jgi:hypothetical protein